MAAEPGAVGRHFRNRFPVLSMPRLIIEPGAVPLTTGPSKVWVDPGTRLPMFELPAVPMPKPSAG